MMALFHQIITSVEKRIPFSIVQRNITFSAVTRLKEIVEVKEGNVLTIEGKIVPDKNEHMLFKRHENGACSLCSANINVKHTDVLILKQFVRSDGCMLPRRTTGLCRIQQKRIGIMVAMAHKAGLIPLQPGKKIGEPFTTYRWSKYNKYFDETTILYRYRV